MSTSDEIAEKSATPKLAGLDSRSRVVAMVHWFLENFEDPADALPYDSREGGFQWLWGGPYSAREELEEAFPDAEETEIAEAAEVLWRDFHVDHWSVANRRLGGATKGAQKVRFARDPERPHSGAVVETVLYPMRDFGWVVRATFIPGSANLPLGDELDDLGIPELTVARLVNSNLIDLIAGLLGDTAEYGGWTPPNLNESLEWLETLERASEVFTSDDVIVHASPPAWASLQAIISHAGTAAPSALMILQDPGNFVMAGLSYGGARIFLRIVKGTEGSVDALFERVNRRIRGDFQG